MLNQNFKVVLLIFTFKAKLINKLKIHLQLPLQAESNHSWQKALVALFPVIPSVLMLILRFGKNGYVIPLRKFYGSTSYT